MARSPLFMLLSIVQQLAWVGHLTMMKMVSTIATTRTGAHLITLVPMVMRGQNRARIPVGVGGV